MEYDGDEDPHYTSDELWDEGLPLHNIERKQCQGT